MRQPDDPGRKSDETTRHWHNDYVWQDRIILRVLAGVALFIVVLLAATLANAQILDRDHYVCDIYVSGHRITWPPKMMGKLECELTLNEIRDKDATASEIKCVCETGGRT